MFKNIESIKTLGDLLAVGEEAFVRADLCFGHGFDNAWDEAVILASHLLRISPTSDKSILLRELNVSEKNEILSLFKKRITERKPAAYLINEAWFAGKQYYVDERVIIPRSPIAELIEQKFSPWVEEIQVKNILDMCTGSGCIAIACAHAFPNANVDAVDISKEALEVAAINCEEHGVSDRVNLIESDMFESLEHKEYDIIVSNPPYVSHASYQALEKEYSHEPEISLVADDEGLAFASTLIQYSNEYLDEDGILVCEVGESMPIMQKRFHNLPLVWLEFQRGGEGVFLLENIV